jgi:hypothetical protein
LCLVNIFGKIPKFYQVCCENNLTYCMVDNLFITNDH